LLPFIEQAPLYSSINFTHGFAHPSTARNTTAFRMTLSMLQCPSDTDRVTSATGHNNDMGNAGSAPNVFVGGSAGSLANGPYAGLFLFEGTDGRGNQKNGQSRTVLSLREILDGTSQTAACVSTRWALGTRAGAEVVSASDF